MSLEFAAFFFSHYGFLLLLSLFAYVIGDRLTARIVYSSASEKFSFCTGLGLGIIASVVFAAGLLHLLTRTAILVLATAGCFLLAPSLKQLAREASRAWQSAPSWRCALFVALFVLAIPILLLPLYPPTHWDSIAYHLAAAKIYAQSHAVVFTPYLRFPVFPQLNEMLFTLALIFYDDLAAQLVQFLMMLLVAVALYAWGRRAFNSRAGFWAAALWLSNPLVVWLGKTAYIDLGLAMFATLAVYAFVNWLQSRRTSWLVVSAVLFGFGAGSKYLALFPLLVCGLILLYLAIKEREPRPLVLFVMIAAAVASPWYIRNAYYTGNPIWPYWGSRLGYGPWTTEDAAVQFQEQTSYGAHGLVSFLRLPWNLAYQTELFHAEFPLSPIYFFLLPFCVYGAIRNKYIRLLLVSVGLYTLFWFGTVQVLRYLISAVPLLSLSAGASLETCLRLLRRVQGPVLAGGLTACVCLLLVAPGFVRSMAPSTAGSLIPEHLPPVTTEQRSAYLEQALPLYPALDFLNRTQGVRYSVYTFPNANMAYFANGRFLGDYLGPARYSTFVDHLFRSEELYEELYQEFHKMGANYLLVGTAHNADAFADKVAEALLDDRFLEGYFKLIYAHSSGLLFEVTDQPVHLSETPELLQNGGFERLSDGFPSEWTATGKPLIDSAEHGGRESSTSVLPDQQNFMSQTVPVDPGAIYLLQCFNRSVNPPQWARLQINWLDKDKSLRASDLAVVSVGPEWHNHRMAAQVLPDAHWAEVVTAGYGGSWMDDCSFKQIRYR